MCLCLQRAATTAALEHGELLRRERELAAKEEELRGWKDARVEQGLAQVKVRIRQGRPSCVSGRAGQGVYQIHWVKVHIRQGRSRCVTGKATCTLFPGGHIVTMSFAKQLPCPTALHVGGEGAFAA